jgi:hypothetical protein
VEGSKVMEKYNPNSKCPKCGCEFLTNQYISQEVGIMRKCTNCQYFFYQEPLDKIDPKYVVKLQT